jgi:DNA mismatch endonuclease (patch repair protein)
MSGGRLTRRGSGRPPGPRAVVTFRGRPDCHTPRIRFLQRLGAADRGRVGASAMVMTVDDRLGRSRGGRTGGNSSLDSGRTDGTVGDVFPPVPRSSGSPGRPVSSSTAVSGRMSRQSSRDTRPEFELRRELFRRGLRYRVNYPVPDHRRRTIDIAFTRARLAVFVDGCFWHSCPEHRTAPKANAEWWRDKLERNRLRDLETNRWLDAAGWDVLRVWEHESTPAAADRVVSALAARTVAAEGVSE